MLAASAPASFTKLALRDGEGIARPLPRPAIALFWAAWCAPCRAEVRDLPAITRAAAPFPVVVVAIDAKPQSRQLLSGVPAAQLRFPAVGSIDISRYFPEDGAGLPLAVAFDRDGKVCASRRGRVTAAHLSAWRARCG